MCAMAAPRCASRSIRCGRTRRSTRSASISTRRSPTGETAQTTPTWPRRAALMTRLPARPRRRRGGLRLVLRERGRSAGADTYADCRRRLCEALGVPRQGPGRVVVEPAYRAGRRARDGHDGVVAAREADLAYRDRRSGGRQGCQRAERLSRSEVVGIGDPAVFGRQPGRPHPVRALEAILSRFDPVLEGHPAGANPISPVYGAPMIDPGHVFVWAWDARPFPAFPDFDLVWADAANWQTGHWITGRLEGMPVDDLIAAVLADFGLAPAALAVDGFLDGYVIERPMSARAALEPLARLFGIDAAAAAGP